MTFVRHVMGWACIILGVCLVQAGEALINAAAWLMDHDEEIRWSSWGDGHEE